jgi:RNA recognition motif-containing protein
MCAPATRPSAPAKTACWPRLTRPPRAPPLPLPRPPFRSVHIVTDYGRPMGIALVEFATPQEAQVAMSKDKQMMGTRYIEVFASSRDELQRYLPRSY